MTISLCGSVIRYRGDDVAKLLVPEGGHIAGAFASELGCIKDRQIDDLEDEVHHLTRKIDDIRESVEDVLVLLQEGKTEKAVAILEGIGA